MKLKTPAVTTSQPPHSEARRAAGRCACRAQVRPGPATSRISAAGSSQATWPPICARRTCRASRSRPTAAARTAAAADAAGLVAGEPAEAVVAEGQLQEAVVLRAADVRPRRRRAPARRSRPTSRPTTTIAAPASSSCTIRRPELGGRGDQVRQRERRHHQQRLQHLGEEAEADERAGQHQPPRSAVLDGPDGRVGAGDQQQHEQRVRVVEAEHQRGDRGQRRAPRRRSGRPPGRTSGARSRTAARPSRRPSAPAGTRMLHELSPKIRTDSAITHSDAGGLVDGDRVGRVGRAEEERLPALRAGLRGGRVERVGPAGGARFHTYATSVPTSSTLRRPDPTGSRGGMSAGAWATGGRVSVVVMC